MTSNIEIVCELTDGDVTLFSPILSVMRGRLTRVAPSDFSAYVDVAEDAISKSSDGPAEEDEEMNAAIDLAEEALRNSLVDTAPEAGRTLSIEIEQFLDYCRQEKTEASREIVARYSGKHNLQGHVKHCFYGAMRFLSEHPNLASEIAATPGDALYDFASETVRAQWREFLREHADEIDKVRGFSFRTLRVYLPATYGGICTGGGGGSSTLKRVLPVGARMIGAQRR